MAENDSCRDEDLAAATDADRCRCKGATLKAYAGMLDSGANEAEAVDAAWRVYRFHHPEDSYYRSRLTVERWIYTERAH